MKNPVLKDPVNWSGTALSNKECQEVMDKFFDNLLEERVELPLGAKIFTTSSRVISEANSKEED